jgi:hypothetical protein
MHAKNIADTESLQITVAPVLRQKEDMGMERGTGFQGGEGLHVFRRSPFPLHHSYSQMSTHVPKIDSLS